MQVILTQDVARVGRRFDVVNVSSGYAQNFLFPRKLAEVATEKKVAALTARKEAATAAHDAEVAELKEKVAALADESLVLEVKADEQGHLFKKIRAEDIVALLSDQHSVTLTKEAVLLDSPLHELGDHSVDVEVAGDRVTLTIQIVAEQ